MEPKIFEVEESKLFFGLKRHAMEELWAQSVFVALNQEFGKVDAQEIFSRVYLQNTSFFVDTANLYTNCGNEAFQLTPSKEAGSIKIVPSIN